MLIPITDPDDPRIEPYRAVRERDLVGRRDRFIVEGEVVLRVLLARAAPLAESLLIADSRVEGLNDLLSTVPDGVPVYTAGRQVMDAIVGFPIHRGVLATGRRPAAIPVSDLLDRLPDQALVVGLVGLANHDNVGGIFRNAAAFGADAVLMDSGTCDPLYRKAIRVSVGGALTVPFARAGSAGTLLDALSAAGFETIALTPTGRDTLGSISGAPRMALLLGAEGPGLPAELLARVKGVRIPMSGGFDSLNVATAGAIALYHLAGTRGLRVQAAPPAKT